MASWSRWDQGKRQDGWSHAHLVGDGPLRGRCSYRDRKQITLFSAISHLYSPLSDLILNTGRGQLTWEPWKPSLSFRQQGRAKNPPEGNWDKHKHSDLISSCFAYASFLGASKHLVAIFPSFCPISEKEVSFGFSKRVKTEMKSNYMPTKHKIHRVSLPSSVRL